ncbi:MAG TPA: tRNA lysidine(34) synthetase TilS [Acidimicrobiales bacterium]|nr:tRNA lysidine(34) synthetase TilS [Acidimicrobiales bacterium]
MNLLPRCAFPAAGTEVTLAVSGGPDSLALLVLASQAWLRGVAVHVDHGLRPGSADEADVVRDAAARYGFDFRSERVEVGRGPNLEARARAARRAALARDALTGHTADDQAETVLLNLMRGSGLDGVRGIGEPWRRPLLSLRRCETQALCATVGLAAVVDPSNNDPAFTRNRVRRELVPLLGDIGRRDPVPLLCRLARLATEDVAVLDELASALDPTDAGALTAAPPAIARRALRAWLRPQLEGYPPDAAAIERVLAVAAGAAVGADVVAGVSVRRSRGRLKVVRA